MELNECGIIASSNAHNTVTLKPFGDKQTQIP